jgi:hypothetical protein
MSHCVRRDRLKSSAIVIGNAHRGADLQRLGTEVAGIWCDALAAEMDPPPRKPHSNAHHALAMVFGQCTLDFLSQARRPFTERDDLAGKQSALLSKLAGIERGRRSGAEQQG